MPNVTKDGKPYRGQGNSRKRMAYARNAALAFREQLDPTAIAQMYIAIMEGKDAKLARVHDEDTGEDTYEIVVSETGGFPPTLEQRLTAMREYLNRGWGQPAQTIQLDHELRGQIAAVAGTVNVGALPPAAFAALRDAMRARAALPESAAPSDGTPDTGELERTAASPAITTIDAECTETSDD